MENYSDQCHVSETIHSTFPCFLLPAMPSFGDIADAAALRKLVQCDQAQGRLVFVRTLEERLQFS